MSRFYHAFKERSVQLEFDFNICESSADYDLTMSVPCSEGQVKLSGDQIRKQNRKPDALLAPIVDEIEF